MPNMEEHISAETQNISRDHKNNREIGCRRSTWTTHTDKQNYPEKQPDIEYFQSSAVILPATTDSKKAFTKRFTKKILQKRFKKTGHWEKADKTTENCFISPAVITIKKEKSVKIALDSRKLNDACVKRKAAMPNMEEHISAETQNISRDHKNNREIGCRRSTWTTHTDKQNYPEKQPDIEYFQSSAVILPATTDSKRAFTGNRIYQPYSRSKYTKYWNLKHQCGWMISFAWQTGQ